MTLDWWPKPSIQIVNPMPATHDPRLRLCFLPSEREDRRLGVAMPDCLANRRIRDRKISVFEVLGDAVGRAIELVVSVSVFTRVLVCICNRF